MYLNSKKMIRVHKFLQCLHVTQTDNVLRSISLFHPLRNLEPDFPSHAQVVICGAGIAGNSVAYHLAESGWTDVVVLEQYKVGSGTSCFGSGILGLLQSNIKRDLIKYSSYLYNKLQNEGHDVGWKQTGSINVATTRDRMIDLRRKVALARPSNVNCEVLSPREIRKYHPYVSIEDLEGAVWVSDDVVTQPYKVCTALSSVAMSKGIRYFEDCRVKEILVEPHMNKSKVKSVLTSLGEIEAEYVVNCAGMWARQLGMASCPQVSVPTHPADHFYVITNPLNDVDTSSFPIIRDLDCHAFLRGWEGGVLIGGFEPKASPAFVSGIPKKWDKHVSGDLLYFKPVLDGALRRFPLLQNIDIKDILNRPDTFAADGEWIIGETAEIDNYFVATAMNGNPTQGGGGIGKAIAEWLINGSPSFDMVPYDIRRFTQFHNNRRFLYERSKEIKGRQYDINYPLQMEFKYGRGLRCSPLYTEMEVRGAVFGARMAFERPLYFDPDNTIRGNKLSPSFGIPPYFKLIKQEYMACRESVAIIDMSSFTKFELKSPGLQLLDYLQKLCCNDINIPVGTLVHTGMLNENGGYENDCMMVRMRENKFFMVSPTSLQARIYDWMKIHLPVDGSISLEDVTSKYVVLNVVGPKSKDLLSQLTSADMDLHPFTAKEICLGYASNVMVFSFTNTGEPGYSLYIPSEYAIHAYQQIMAKGRDFGIRDAGYFALRYLRIEKFIPFWAEELDGRTTPFETGKNYKVKLEKPEFYGKEALLKQRQGTKKRLVHFQLNNFTVESDLWPWGNEPIYRNGVHVGSTTSSGYGFTLGRMVCLGFVTNPCGNELDLVTSDYILAKNANYEIDIAGRRFSARASLHPPSMPVVNMDGLEDRYKPKMIEHKLVAKHMK